LDDTYQVYVNRVARMTLPESYRSQVQHIQASPKFQQYPGGDAKPVPFPGYSVITPPWVDDAKNEEFYRWLQTYQQQLLQQVEPGVVVPVPADSFHLTLADLIWDSAYHHAKENPDFETKLREQIAQSFEQSQPLVQGEGQVLWQALGLIVMTRAIGVCLVPADESSYQRVLHMRRSIYQNSNLMGLGIEQQYHFTAHITLGYFGTGSIQADRDRLGQALNDLNQQQLESGTQKLWVHRAELRKFDDMTRYYREADWSALEF
jgi:hypothetical protein